MDPRALPAAKKCKSSTKVDWCTCFKTVPAEQPDDLISLVKSCFLESNILSSAHTVDHTKLDRLLVTIRSSYNVTPYHNFTHAVHVFMGAYSLLQNSCIKWTRIEKAALLFTAITHDLEHQGVSNVQLVKEKSPIAVHYSNQSVAENNSLDKALALLQHRDQSSKDEDKEGDKEGDEYTMNIFDDFTIHEKSQFDVLCKDLILATDITNQVNIKDIYAKIGEAVSQFKANTTLGTGSNGHAPDKAHDTAHGTWIESDDHDIVKINASSESNRCLALCLLMKCADVGAPLQSIETASVWAERFYNENSAAHRDGRGDAIDHDGFVASQGMC